MALTISDLWTRLTKSELKESLLDIAQASGLPVRDWVVGQPSERWLEVIPRVLDQVLGTVILQAVQGFFLDQATDPGDPGDPTQTEIKAGWLSELGRQWFSTERRGQIFATGTITVTNNNATTQYLAPGELVVQRSTVADDGAYPTYTSTADDTIYTGPGGTLELLPAASADIPVQADVIGTYSNASSAQITVLVTGTYGSLAVTNAAPALGEDREDAEDYRERCRRAPARTASGAPTASYEYAATTALDGTPLQRPDGTGVVSITKVFVDDAITEAGSVTVYCADGDGAALAADIDGAHANITGIPDGVLTEVMGVVPGSVDYATEPAVENTINVVGTMKIKTADAGGLTALELQTIITDALAEYFRTFPIGGLDQLSGAGKLYTGDLVGIAKDARPGFYAPVITTPAGSSTNLALGEVAELDSDPSTDWVVTIT